MKRHLISPAYLLTTLGTALFTLSSCELGGGMVMVSPNATVGTTAVFYIDKYENSLREKRKRSSSGDIETTLVAESRANMIPASSINYTDAKTYCEDAGKRLCTKKEWLTACVGPDNLKASVQNSVTSPARIETICSVGVDPTKTTDLVAKAGSNSRCLTRGVPVFDMVGNLSEWVTDESGEAYPIGASSTTPAAQGVCDTFAGYDTDGDNDNDLPYSSSTNATEMGFRCCSNTGS